MSGSRINHEKRLDSMVRKIIRDSIATDLPVDVDAAVEAIARRLPGVSRYEISAAVVTGARLVGQDIIWNGRD